MQQAIINVLTSYSRMLEVDHLTAFRDSGGVWTIGDGHTGPDVHVCETITLYQERMFLERDNSPLIAYLDTLADIRDNPMYVLAYYSFAYNCGMGALKGVRSGVNHLAHYIHDRQGVVQPGLVSRRRFELALLGADISVLDNPQPIPAAVTHA